MLPPLIRTGAGLACALLLAGCCAPAFAAESVRPAEAKARDLAGEVLRRAGHHDLGDWTRGVLERALGRAAASGEGPDASPAPLPAERQASRVAGGPAGRGSTAEAVVFMSLSVPAASWRQWAREAAAVGAPLVLRGVGPEGFRAFVKRVGERLGGAEAGVAVDPRLFRLFDIERVPAVAVVPGGVPPCESRGCADDPAPPHDRVTGNIGLAAALEAIAAEGEAGREAARRLRARLEGGGE